VKFIQRSITMVLIQIITLPLFILPFIWDIFASIIYRESFIRLFKLSWKYTMLIIKWEFHYMNTGELSEIDFNKQA